MLNYHGNRQWPRLIVTSQSPWCFVANTEVETSQDPKRKSMGLLRGIHEVYQNGHSQLPLVHGVLSCASSATLASFLLMPSIMKMGLSEKGLLQNPTALTASNLSYQNCHFGACPIFRHTEVSYCWLVMVS